MNRACLITAASLLVSIMSANLSAETHSITLDRVTGSYASGDTTYLIAEQEVQFRLRITNNGTPGCSYAPAMAFQIYSPDGASWDSTSIEPGWIPPPGPQLGYPLPYFDNLFDMTFIEQRSITGSGSDSIGFAGITFGTIKSPWDDYGIFEGLDDVCLIIKINPTILSTGTQICLDTVDGIDGYEWGWHRLQGNYPGTCQNLPATIPEWDGPHIFTVISCCGLYTGGETGNVDCDQEGQINLADITRLIDYIYLSRTVPCCSANGNVDGDEEAVLNLADVTALIERIYGNRLPMLCH